MNQQAIDWLLSQEPGAPTVPENIVPANQPAPPNPANNDDLFADIPIAGQPPQAKQRTPVESVKDDLFADIPVTPQAIEQEPSLWGQFKAGIADVASGYYSNKALQQAEEYQAIKDNKTGLLGLSKLGIYDVNTGVISPNKEQELKEREEEIGTALKKSQEYQTYSENMPMPESVRNFLDPTRESHSSWWEDLKVAPVEIALNVTAKSGPASLLSLGGAMAGGVTAGIKGAMVGSGAVSGRIEYINSIKQGLQEAGIDWTDPQAFISAINNDELMDPIREKGLKRGIAIGTLDAAAAFVGGKVIAPKSLFAKSAAKAQGINLPAQVVAQAGLGAGGEAAGQYWSEGEISDVRAIAAEAVGEMTFAPVEATATLYSVARGSKGIAQDRLKATNELLDILNRKRQKAYNSRDPKAIDKANTEFNEYLNIRQELEQQLKNTDAESLLKAEKTLSTVIDAKQRQYNQANAEQRPALERELKELNKRRDVVFDAIHSQGRTIQAPELMEQKEALDLVKADREFRQEQRRAEEEELYHKRTNPLAAADEEARKIAEQGGDALDQQLGASNAYSTARSTDEIADDIASMEGARQATEQEQDIVEEIRRTEQQYADSQGLKKIVAQKKLKNLQQQLQTLRSQPVEEIVPVIPTEEPAPTDTTTGLLTEPEPYQPKSLYQIVREGKERRAREGDWEAAEAQAQVQQAGQTQQEIAAWEASQGITEQEAIQQRRQENLHNELRKAWQQVHQQSVNEAHGIIDEAMELGLIDNEASARQLADNGEIPPNLTQRIANEKRLLAREKAETNREAFVEKQQHRQKVARLEQHIADQQKARDYELALQQRDENLADITEGEINDWEDRLGITQETAIDEAAQARQARQTVAEPTAEELLAERVRLAHQEIDAAIKNGELGLLGEPLAREYADRGEIPPNLQGAKARLNDQISKLEQVIEKDKRRNYLKGEVTKRRPFVMKIVEDWTKKSKAKKQFVENEATHIYSDPETGERIPVVYLGNSFIKGLDLYNDIDGNDITGRKEQFSEIPGREQPRLLEVDELPGLSEEEIAYWDEQDRIKREEKQKSEQNKEQALHDEYVEEQRILEESRIKAEARRIESEKEEQDYQARKAQKEEAKKQHIETTKKDIGEAKSQARELRKDQDLIPKEEPTPWLEIKDKVLSRFGNEQARSIPWARKLEDAYKQNEQWQDTLMYADENVAIFTGRRGNGGMKVTYAVKQKDAADFIAWANVSGKREASPTTWDKEDIESTIESWGIEKGGYGIANVKQGIYIDGHGFSRSKIFNPGEHDKRWSGGWRGAYTRVIGIIDKNGGIFQDRKPTVKKIDQPTLNRMEKYDDNNQQISEITSGRAGSKYFNYGTESTPGGLTEKGKNKVRLLETSNKKLLEKISEYATENYLNEEQWNQALEEANSSSEEWSFAWSEKQTQEAVTESPNPEAKYGVGETVRITKGTYTGQVGTITAVPTGDSTVYGVNIPGNDKKSRFNESSIETVPTKTEQTEQNKEAEKEAKFEAKLKQIGKEWIKDQQHRFYFSDIIQQLAGTDQQIPGNAKLWYDKRTGFYGSENLNDAVYDAAVERLELLRQSIIDEHGKQALETTEASTPEVTDTAKQDVEALVKQFPDWNTTSAAHIYHVAQGLIDLGLIENEPLIRKVWKDEFAVQEIIKPVIEQYTGSINETIKPSNNDQSQAPAEQPPTTTRPADFGKNNTIFTEDKVAAARERIRKKLSQFNAGFDPEMAADMFAIGGYYIEGGYRKFKDFSAGMIEEFGDAVKPYLKSAYESVRMYPELAEQVKEMDSHDFVASTDIDELLAASNETIKPLNNDQEGNTPLEDLKALYLDLINQRNELEATNQVGDDRLDRKIAQTKDAIKELEQEQTEQGPTTTTEETETFDPKEFSNVEGNLADLTVDNLKAIGESQKYGLNSIAQRLGRSVTDPQQLYDIIQDHIALLDKIPFHIKKTLRAQLEKDQWDKTIPFSKLSDKVLADLREVLPVKYFDINQNRLDLSYIAREIQLEAEGKIHKEDRTPRGFTQESGSHTFNKEDGSTETFSYNRIADMDKVSGSPEVVAPFFVELKEGDLLLDRSGRKMGVISNTKGGKIHFKGEQEPWPINVEVHKDDRRKLGDEIRSLKAEQKGKPAPAPAPTTPTTTTEETTTGTQWVRITPDDVDQLPIGSTIRISTGTPKPTQAKKLKEWEKFNVTGTLKEKGNYGGTPHLTLFKGMNGFMPNQSMYPMSPDLIFEVEQQPGTVSDNETIKSLNNDQEQGASTEPQDNRNTPIDSAKFNTPLEFGKYKGKTINEIGAEDRGYLRWLADTSMKRNALISDHAGEWLDTNGQWSTDEITEAATLARENILNNESILSGKETSAEITRRMGKKDQVVTITPYPNHLKIENTTYTTKYGGGRSKEIREQTRRNEYTYKALSEVLTDQEVSQLKKLADSDTVESPPSIETMSETTPNEGTRTTGQGTLEGVSPGEVQETTGSGNPGERSPDHTGQGSGYDHGTDGRRSGDELGGSPAPGVSGVDIHGAGAVSQGEVGTGGTDRAGGINSDSVDYSITAQDEIESASFSDTQKYQGNIAAIKLLKELGQRPATLEQKKVLAKYVGWGGLKQAFYREDGTTRKGWEKQAAELKALLTPEEYEAARASTLNAHYTSWDVVHPIFQALKNIGFTGGRMLEPSMGVGNFFGMMPNDMRRKSRLVGVELDNITGGIAQKLYGNSARIHAPRGFESFDLADGTYDVVIGNPPFGDETITDAKRKDISGLRIHNYFFAKSMKALRPGGVMAMVVSKGFMDSSKNQKGRDMMFREARLLGAFRLPNQAFKANANADVTTDIIFLQKREAPLLEGDTDTVNDYRSRKPFVGADGNTMQINQYFVDHPDHLLGDMIMNTGRFGPELEPAMTARKGFDWKKALNKGIKKLEGRYNPEANIELHSATGTPDASTDIQRAEIDGLYINDQGQLSRRLPDLEGDTQGKPVTSYTNNQGKVIELKPAQINKLTDAVKLARKARHLINMQVTDMTDPQLEPLRQELSRDYDAFVKKYHMLNRPLFKSLLNQTDLTIAPMLFALENGYKKERKVDGKTVKESSSKADIFTRRTQEPFTQVTKVSSAEEALIVALSQTGKVDLDRMSELSGISRTALVSQLTDIIYDDPVAGWVTRDEYLSGNVKRKLRQAKEMGRGYEDNVKALEAVQPVDIPATEIITTLGAHWQTPEVINQFWAHLGGQLAQSTFVPERSTWTFTGSETSGKHKWRTDEMTMKDLVKSLLNNKAIGVYKTDPITEKRILDVRATDAALAKATEIQNEFLAWLWRDTQRREAMVRRYNDLVNTDVNRQFDGSFLTFPGKVSDLIVKLRKTQANAVWRIVQSATTLLDHVVGAGKTFTMVAAAMELKRTGLAKKPMIVVPNHLVAQWAEDFARLYPNAKILAATKQDFSAKRRKEMLARIATGNWDAVIIAHSSFGKMPTDPETEQWFIRKQIEELTVAANALREAEGKGTRSVREAENARKKLREKLKELIENTDKDVGMTWNETGVDALFVDEAHEFKNLQFFTSMNRVKNINPAGSKKAQDLFIKIQALLNKTGGRNLVFATGTPVSNSMAELYTMQRYLSHEQLVESGTNHFDAWARTFGTTVTNQERTSSGKYGPVSRFSEFINLPELITKYKGFADTINNEDIRKALAEEGKGIHIPTVKGGKPQAIVAPRSVYQEAYMGQIEYRFENMPEDPRVDNPLKATNDARKAGLDMRMIYPELPDDPSSKINKSVKNMMRLYDQWSEDKGTQLVFCDLSTPKSQQAKEIKDFRTMVEEAAKDDDNPQNTKGMDVQELYDYLQTMADNGNEKAISRLEKVTQDDIEGWNSKFDVYNDVKTKLMEAGVPEAEIAFIHNANTDTQKQDLFDKVNRGEIRFLLGSTAKMGAGTNVQERLVGLHHLDAPWRPSDLEQREGRIIRQGNKLFLRDPAGFEIEILRYATEQTYDVNMWQMLEVKALFIQQLRNGSLTDRTAKDVGGEAASAAEMKAASSGDPRIIEQVALLARLKTLDNLRQTHIKDKTQAAIKVESLEQNKRSLPASIESYRQDYERRIIPKDGPGLTTPDGKTFEKSTKASDWFKQQILTRVQDTESDIWFGAGEVIANYRGFEVTAKLANKSYRTLMGKTKEGINLRLDLTGNRDYFIISDNIEEIKWDGLFARFNNAIERMNRERLERQNELDNIDARIREQEELSRSPFKEEAEYQRKLERNLALIEELGNEDTVNEQAQTLAEYQLLSALAEDYFNRTSENIAETLENTALGNRANKLARRILYSKEGDEKIQATEAIEQARDQGLTITEKEIKAAQKRIDEAEAQRKLEEKKIKENAKNTGESTPVTTVTTDTTITFTSADEAIKHAQESKQAITADNGNIRLERSSLGNWQLSVAWQDKAGFDEDSIVMDTDLSLMTGGRGFTAVGDKMVMTFKEDRLPVVIRRLYGKMPLQGIKAEQTETGLSEPILRREAKGTVTNPMTSEQVDDIVQDELKNLDIDAEQYVDIRIENTVEDIYGPGYEPFQGAIATKSGSERPTIILIASLHKTSAEVRATLQHELIGHFGMAKFISAKEKQKLLNKVKISRKALKPAWDYVEKHYGDVSLDEQAEEVVAYIAEHPHRKNTRWENIVNHIIRLLKKAGFFKQQVSHDEIVDTLSSVARVMKANGRGNLFYTLGVGESTRYYGPGIVTMEQHKTGSSEQLTEPIHLRRDGSADVTSPNNSNNPADNANRLFSTLALAENELIRNALKVTGRKASSGMAHFRKLMLPTMGLRQIVDTYESIFDPMAADIDIATNTSKGNPVQKYQRYVQGMQSLKANKLAEADNVDKQWGELAKANPTEYNALADMMHEATVYEVFPEKDYFIEHENMRELRRDYAREQNPAKQAELRKRIMFERERLTVYNKLSEQYQQMSQQAKDVYQAVEGFHEDMWNDHQKALEDKITRSMQNSDEARAFIQQLKAQFHEAKVRGPYFPLQRFGSFYLIAEDQQGVYYREHYETEAQLYKHKEEIEKSGMSVLSFGLMPDFTSRKLEGVSGFADQIHVALESDKFANVSAAIKDEIRTEINQLALQMLPDVSAAKSMIRRRKVKGYSENARRAFAFSSIHQSNRLARTVYGDQMTAELERIHDDIDSHNENPLMDMAHRTIAAQVLSELEKQHETIMNPKGSPVAARITNLAFIWYLGASAGAGFINMSQTVLIGIPLMGGRFGYRKTTAAVAKAAKDFGLHGYNKMSLRESMFTLSKATQGVTDDEKRMLQQLIDDGTIDTTQTSTLSQITDQDLRAEAQVNQDRWVKINRLLGYFFHNAEVANREVTALATYRMAIAEGQTHETAVEIARKLTFDSHFDYSGANRPRVMKNDWMKVFTIFKQYSQNMTYTLVRNFVKSRPFSKFSPAEKKQARKALFGILVAHATAAGTLGLPLVSIIGPVLAEAFGDDDDEFRDWKTMYRNWLSDLVGKDMGHAIAKGVFNGFMGTDIHARVKIDDLWIQEPNWEMSAREESMHYLLQGLGPASSAAINVLWLGPEQIADGNTWKGIEKMVPKFIRDGMRTIRYANEGATVGRGGYQAMIEEFTPGELARQFLGISPARVSEGYEARGAVKNLEQKISGRRGELMQGYTRAYMEGDYEKANKILTDIQTFNVSNPLYGITGDALRQSLRMKYRYQELSQSGIYLPEAKMGLLNEARFAL